MNPVRFFGSFTRRWGRGFAFLAFALIALFILALQAYHFHGLNYRDDEIRTVHAGMTMSIPEVVQWMGADIHPPFWRVTATAWVSLFGMAEPVTRFLSLLYSALALAFMYRLARDLFDAPAALLATLLLGTHALYLFYAGELRPYAALVLWTNALHLVYLRWLRVGGFKYALLYVLIGAAALYTHFFALYVIAAHVVVLLVLVRFRPRVYLRAFGLFALVGLAFVGWLPSFLHSFLVAKPGGVDYGFTGELSSPSYIYSTLQMRPLVIGNLLQGFAILAPIGLMLGWRLRESETRAFRFGLAWRKWYFAIVAAVILGGAFITDIWIDVLTRRNFIVIVPSLAVLAALGLRALPWRVSLIALLLILSPAVRDFIRYERYLPYREVADAIEPRYESHTPVVLSVDNGTGAYFAFAYYLMDRLPGQLSQSEMVYLTLGEGRVNLPEPMRHVLLDDSAAALATFESVIGNSEYVWWVTSGYEPPHAATFRHLLERQYTRIDSATIDNPAAYQVPYRVDLYHRQNLIVERVQTIPLPDLQFRYALLRHKTHVP